MGRGPGLASARAGVGVEGCGGGLADAVDVAHVGEEVDLVRFRARFGDGVRVRGRVSVRVRGRVRARARARARPRGRDESSG